MSDPTFWILARATGITAYVLMSVSMLAGLLLKARVFAPRIRPVTTTEIHRMLALLSLGSIALHAATLVADSAVEISPLALLVPGIAPYRPLWTGLGVVSAELTILIIASFSLRKRIGHAWWRRLHWATYGAFALATLHGIAAGTDTTKPWALAMYVAAAAAVAAATGWRATTTPRRGSPRRRTPSAKEATR